MNTDLAFQRAQDLGFTDSEWARRSGVTRETIRLWRHGADIKLNTLVKLCKPLGLDWADILMRKDGKRK